MRKVITLLLIFELSILFFSQEVDQTESEVNENPMDSFMGMKWNISALEFINNFKFKADLNYFENGIAYLFDWKIGDLKIKTIYFCFETKYKTKLKFIKKTYEYFFFKTALLYILPEIFEDLFEIFKIKYGEPYQYHEEEIQDRMGTKFLQKKALWLDSKKERMITLNKYYQEISKGLASFIPYDQNIFKEKKEKLKDAAEDL